MDRRGQIRAGLGGGALQVWSWEGEEKRRTKADSSPLGLSHRMDGPATSWGRTESGGAPSG